MWLASRTVPRPRLPIPAVALFLLTLSACSAGLNVHRAVVSPDGTGIGVEIESCVGGLEVDVDEQADRVVIHVTVAAGTGAAGGGCSEVAYLQLQEPLGGRPLIDAWDGSEIEVEIDPSVPSGR